VTSTERRELQLLVDSVGLTPAQAIRAATSINARALGIADSVGTIGAGSATISSCWRRIL
jgi:imidazolonepropionase-like amidohydrolase